MAKLTLFLLSLTFLTACGQKPAAKPSPKITLNTSTPEIRLTGVHLEHQSPAGAHYDAGEDAWHVKNCRLVNGATLTDVVNHLLEAMHEIAENQK